eukprot:Amastigsp_a677563_49.p3 type:complete len:134 gc:universal Amastigsp_a677563_49:1187-786(-)
MCRHREATACLKHAQSLGERVALERGIELAFDGVENDRGDAKAAAVKAPKRSTHNDEARRCVQIRRSQYEHRAHRPENTAPRGVFVVGFARRARAAVACVARVLWMIVRAKRESVVILYSTCLRESAAQKGQS